MVWIAYALVWISMAAVVSVGIFVTENWHLLWFMLLPCLISIRTTDKKVKNEDDNK